MSPITLFAQAHTLATARSTAAPGL
jgi:hypothetical protein